MQHTPDRKTHLPAIHYFVVLILTYGCISDAPQGGLIGFDTLAGQMLDSSISGRGGVDFIDFAQSRHRDGSVRVDGMSPSARDTGRPTTPAIMDQGTLIDMRIPMDAARFIDAARPLDMASPDPPVEDAGLGGPFVTGPATLECEPGDYCECRGQRCDILCEGDGCNTICGPRATDCNTRCFGNGCYVECGRRAQCSGRCEGNGCQTRCAAGSTCLQGCFGNGCRLLCQDDARCTFNCEGGNCFADCANAAQCSLRCRGDNCLMNCGQLDPGNCQLDCEGNGCQRLFNP